jgi:hypothetical protein
MSLNSARFRYSRYERISCLTFAAPTLIATLPAWTSPSQME